MAEAEHKLDLDVMEADERSLPAGPWELWTSCSFRRITGPDGKEGGVLHAYNQRSDNHPDLSMPEEQLFALVRLRNALPRLIEELREARRYAALGQACEANGLGWYDPSGEMLFQPPADVIAEAASAPLREALLRIAYLRPVGPIQYGSQAKALVEQMELIAIEAIRPPRDDNAVATDPHRKPNS